MTRRSFVALAGVLLSGCAARTSAERPPVRLRSRPGEVAKGREPGTHALGLRPQRDALLYVPKSASPDKPAPLLIYLHGATGSEQQGIRRLSAFADELGFLLLSPASEDGTWDAIQGDYGPDVRAIDQALARVFTMRRVDSRKIAVAGFSDGATYALGLGLSNGDLFGSVLAFSPGFIPPGTAANGKPRIFVSHGTNDQILPIDRCSRMLVPELKRKGYQVTYREFDGPHAAPAEIMRDALRWFLE